MAYVSTPYVVNPMTPKENFKDYATKHRGLSHTLVDKYISSTSPIENMTYSVIEERPQPFREINVFSRLIMNRIIFLGQPITADIANIITAQLLYLESVDPKKPITIYINSPGGSVYDGLAIYDTIQYINPDVHTVCVGLAASMGAVLLCGGSDRCALPHARIMIHQPLGDAKGQMSDMQIILKEITALAEDLYKILARHTKQPIEIIREDANRDFWMTATEAKRYGVIDHILTKDSNQ